MAKEPVAISDKTIEEKIQLFRDTREQKNQLLKQNEKPIHLLRLKLIFYFLTILKGSSNIVGFSLTYRLMLGAKNVLAAAWGMTYLSLVVDIVNFFRIPFLLLLSKLAGEDKKLTVSKTAKWLYSSCVLVLGILSLVLPSLSSFILIALMVAAIVDAIVLLSKVCFSRQKEKANLTKTQSDYPYLIKELLILEAKIESLSTEEEQELDSNLVDYQEKVAKLHEIALKYVNAKRRLEKNDSIRLTDKIAILFLSILGLTASTLVLTLPLLGVVLFSFTSAIAVVYLFSRLVMEIYWPKKLALENELIFDYEVLSETISLNSGPAMQKKSLSNYPKLFPEGKPRQTQGKKSEITIFEQDNHGYQKNPAPTTSFF